MKRTLFFGVGLAVGLAGCPAFLNDFQIVGDAGEVDGGNVVGDGTSDASANKVDQDSGPVADVTIDEADEADTELDRVVVTLTGAADTDASVDAGAANSVDAAVCGDGSGEAAALTCSETVPSTATIVGTSINSSWITYTYESSGQSEATVSTTSSGLNVVASVVPESGQIYVGAGVAFNSTSCIDASAYNGISFKLSGSLGTCSILFYVQDVEDTSSTAYPRRGVCTAGACCGPSFELTTTGTFTVPFSQMMAGTPRGPIDPAQITSVQWSLSLPADADDAGEGCSANYTLSNVEFVTIDGG